MGTHTTHIGSHSVTCHPAEVTFPPLPPTKLVLDLAASDGCKAELTYTMKWIETRKWVRWGNTHAAYRLYRDSKTRTFATRYVSRTLVNCTTVGTSCTRNPQQIEVPVVWPEGYGWSTCSKQPRRVDRRRYRQQSRSSTVFVDNTLDLPWRNFPSPQFGTKFQRKVPSFLGNIPQIFLQKNSGG